MKNLLLSVVAVSLFSFHNLLAVNQLTVKDKGSYGSKAGYIEKATLVVQPLGAYVEQSLYLEYSERNQFSSKFLEIVHRFELPKDAVVNDMWLWMGNNVMRAQMFDTWSARHIYDSIVATKYDPAFLTKTGSQYELKIYPLEAGSYRKVKITFLVPTRWYGNQATAELPLKMLLANNSLKKPLEILFRTQKDKWGVPLLAESPETKFTPLVDTMGFSYQHVALSDISFFSSLNLKYNSAFNEGYYISGYQDKSDSTYFQLGILPENFFNVKTNLNSQKVLVALDFSGTARKSIPEKMPKYRALIESSIKYNDNFKLIISGNEKIVDYTNGILPASSLNLNTALDDFEKSNFAKEINYLYKPNVLFCDFDASTNWNFTNLSTIANVVKFDKIDDALSSITRSDIVSAYRHGSDDPISQNAADMIIARLDTLFGNGGRFLTYYDYNREGKEKLATHYIQGLKVKSVNHNAVTLYRNPEGNIGQYFPESFTRNSSYFLTYTDPDVKVELRDQAGNASVISKKIKNGLLVVTGIWSLRDDAGMKTLLGVPLLGVNAVNKPFTLDKLLARIKQEQNSNNFSKVIILSDSDSLISKYDANIKAQSYMSGFTGKAPKFYSLNLLDNDVVTPGYITDSQTEYYGSGYYLKVIAELSKGIHIEKHLYDWPYIGNLFSPYAIPNIDNIKISAVADGYPDNSLQLREVNKIADPNKPRFFLGKSNGRNSIVFSITGRFEGEEKDSTRKITFLVPHDTTTYNKVVKSMLGNELINDKFNLAKIDTAGIVKLSIANNILTDYTALLALEPNDKFHFIKNPFDEGGLSDIKLEEEADTTFITAFPNPFNSMTTIKMHLKSISSINVAVYNVLGERVFSIAEEDNVEGEKTFVWEGKNNFGNPVGSGVYILVAIVKDAKTKKQNVYANKLIQLK